MTSKKKANDTFRTRLYDFTEETLDATTGELKRIRKRYGIKVKTNNFYFTFIDNMSGYFKLTSGIDKNVLTKLCCMAEFDTGRVFIRAEEKKELCIELDISRQQFTNAISSLKKLSLISGERGFYMINPAVYWRGTSSTREKLLNDDNIAVEFNFELEDESNIPPQNL